MWVGFFVGQKKCFLSTRGRNFFSPSRLSLSCDLFLHSKHPLQYSSYQHSDMIRLQIHNLWATTAKRLSQTAWHPINPIKQPPIITQNPPNPKPNFRIKNWELRIMKCCSFKFLTLNSKFLIFYLPNFSLLFISCFINSRAFLFKNKLKF